MEAVRSWSWGVLVVGSLVAGFGLLTFELVPNGHLLELDAGWIGGAILVVALAMALIARGRLTWPGLTRLRETNRRLQEELAEQAAAQAELAEAFEVLGKQQQALLRSERLAAVGQVAASIGHDLRNPLFAMRNAIAFVSQKVTVSAHPDLDARVPQFLSLMAREIGVSIRSVDALLDCARERALSLRPCPLRPLVDEAVDLVMCGDVVIENRVAVERPTLRLDHAQFRRALVNLLQNAADASAGSEAPVVVSADGGGGQPWIITIADRGCGISAEALPKIFEPLYTSKPTGTGLGLAIVQKIVAAHGGKLEVKSELGVGTTFTITLTS